jgi:hypothetical protein
MATITYNCSVCARSIDLVENQQGLTTFSKCVITYGCKGKLLAVKRNPDNIRGTFPTEVPGLEDYIPRNVLFNYTQTTASATWTINHNLNTVPAVSIYAYNPVNELVELNVNQYTVTTVNQNTLLITFTSPQTGMAQCISRNTITPPVVAAPTPVTLSQVTANGVFTFAVPKYLTRFDYPPSILPQPSLPFDLINNSNIRIEVTITLPNVAPVTCTEYLSTSLTNTPWLAWNEILVRKRKNCYVFSKNILDFRTFGGQITSLDQIPDGTQLEITRIDYGTGVLQPIDTEGLYILLANSPYTSNDKILDTIIDVGDMVDNDIPYFSFNNTDFYVDPSNVDPTYPNIAQVVKPKAFVVPTPTATPTPSVTVSVSNTPPPTQTPTPSVTQSPHITPSAGLTYDEAVEDKGPDAYWPLNTDMSDVISGNNLNYIGVPVQAELYESTAPSSSPTPSPTASDNVYFVPDNFGHYFYFAAPSLGLIFDNPISFTLGNFSLEAWVESANFDQSSDPNSDGYYTIFGTDVYGLQFDSTGALYLYGNSDSVYALESDGVTTLTLDTNTVYHIVTTVDTSGNVIFYVNGTPYNGNKQITEQYNFTYVGTDNSGEYFIGNIGNPAIYGFVMTQAQVLQNYNIGTTTYRYAYPWPYPMFPSTTPFATPTPTPTPQMVLNQTSIEPYGTSQENTLAVTFYSASLCDSQTLSSAVTEINSWSLTYNCYNAAVEATQDVNCQIVNVSSTGTITETGTFDSDEYVMEQYNDAVYNLQQIPDDLANALQSNPTAITWTLQTNIGQIITYYVHNLA